MAKEIQQPSQIAQAYVDRIEKVAAERNLLPLDEQLLGYAVISDIERGTLYLLLSQSAFENRRDQYNHDVGAIAQSVLAQHVDKFRFGEWIEANVPIATDIPKLFFHKPGYILEITQKDDSADSKMLVDEIYDAMDQAAIASGMLSDKEQDFALEYREIFALHSIFRKGYTIQFYMDKGLPALVMTVDVRHILVDKLLDQYGPHAFLAGFTRYYFPETPPDKSEDRPVLPITFDRSETVSINVPRLNIPEDEEEEYFPAFVYTFRLDEGMTRPIIRLTAFRQFIESEMERVISEMETEMHPGYTEVELSLLSTKQLLDLHRDTADMDTEDRRASVNARIEELGVLDEEDESVDDEEEDEDEDWEDEIAEDYSEEE